VKCLHRLKWNRSNNTLVFHGSNVVQLIECYDTTVLTTGCIYDTAGRQTGSQTVECLYTR